MAEPATETTLTSAQPPPFSIRFADDGDTEPPSSIREAERLGDLHTTLEDLIAIHGVENFRAMASTALADARDTITPAATLADFDDDIAEAIGRTAIEDEETRDLLAELQGFRRSPPVPPVPHGEPCEGCP